MEANKTNPLDEIRKDVDSARSDLSTLIQDSSLSTVKDEYSDLDTKIANFGLRIQQIRDRKYAFNKIVEDQGKEFQKQWTAKKFMIQSQINTEANNLRMGLRPLETRVSSLQVSLGAASLVRTVKNDIENYKSRINSSESSTRALFDGIKTEVEKVSAQLDKVESTLDNVESASFGFLPGESVVMAVKAVWTRDNNKEDKDDPEGILFLTDQRMIFEQKEEIATKKVLFVTTEREKVQKLLFEVPVVSIETVKAEKHGLFKNEDWLEMVMASGSFARDVSLHLDGQDCNEWQKLITRVKTKDIDSDRAIAVDQAAVEKARSAPSQCPFCGGAITKPVLRGQDTITCDFCGKSIRL